MLCQRCPTSLQTQISRGSSSDGKGKPSSCGFGLCFPGTSGCQINSRAQPVCSAPSQFTSIYHSKFQLDKSQTRAIIATGFLSNTSFMPCFTLAAQTRRLSPLFREVMKDSVPHLLVLPHETFLLTAAGAQLQVPIQNEPAGPKHSQPSAKGRCWCTAFTLAPASPRSLLPHREREKGFGQDDRCFFIESQKHPIIKAGKDL